MTARGDIGERWYEENEMREVKAKMREVKASKNASREQAGKVPMSPRGTLDDLDEDGSVAAMKKRLRESAGKGASRGKAGREPVTSVAKVESDRSRKNSRTKGNRAELDVAEMFSRWSGEVVRRTPQSGGWSSAKFGVTADLVCPNVAFPYHVEIKHREGWVLDDLVTGVRKNHDKSIVQWWNQCIASCPKDKVANFVRTPLLVFRRNRQPWLVMSSQHDVPAGDFDVMRLSFSHEQAVRISDAAVMRLDDFLDFMLVPKGLKNYKRLP